MVYIRDVRKVLKTAIRHDLEWLSHGRVPGQKPDPVYNPWMPFQAADFIALLAEVTAESQGYRFLDVGSGIGTKMRLASYLFGYEAVGIEIDPEMASFASRHYGLRTLVGDALKVTELYKTSDVIWMYRPFKDGFKQAQLEHRIFDLMKRGAVVFGGAWETQPNGFEIIVDDWDTGHRGAWKKPLNWEPVIYDINEDDE